MSIILKSEEIDLSKIKLVIDCKNIKLDDESVESYDWLASFKARLKKYKEEKVVYTQTTNVGRYYLRKNGILQCSPRDVRKYLCDGKYVDVDMVNSHPVILENYMRINKIEVPIFLQEYNKNREETIKKYQLVDKTGILKIINLDVCNSNNGNIQDFHHVLYNDVKNKLQETYNYNKDNKEKKEKNETGSFMAKCLQDLENDILMCMYKTCSELHIEVRVLCFDGFMLKKESYKPELLNILEEKVKNELNYNIKLIEKSMETDWAPEQNPESILYSNVHEMVKSLQICDIEDDLDIKDENHLVYSIKNNNLVDMLHKMKNKKCGERLSLDIMLNNSNKMVQFCVNCSKCKKVHPSNDSFCENKDLELFNLIKNNTQLYIVQNNINIGQVVINTNTNDDDIDLVDYVQQDVISGDKKIDDLLYKLLCNNLDSEYCEIIYELCKDKLKVHNENWWRYGGNIWNKMERGDPIEIYESMKKIIEYLKILYKCAKERKQKYLNKIKKNTRLIEKRLCKNNEEKQFAKAMKKYFNDDYFVNKLDTNKMLIAFENGVFDIVKRELREGKPEDFLSKKIQYNLEEHDPKKNEFILNVFSDILPHQDVREYLLKVVASCLNGNNDECIFIINTGKGRNGKNLFYDSFTHCLGPYAMNVEPTILTKAREKANESNEAMITLDKVRYVLCSEPNNQDVLRSEIIKALTGNTSFRARGNYEKLQNILINFKIFLLCNKIPLLDKCENAEVERLRIIEFVMHFVEDPKLKNERKIDFSLSSKMEKCKSQLFLLLVEYYHKYKLEGLITPERVKRKTMVYRDKVKNADDIVHYISERLIVGESSDYLKCKDIWKDYIEWCRENNKKSSKQCDLEDCIDTSFDIEKEMYNKSYVYKSLKCIKEEYVDDFE